MSDLTTAFFDYSCDQCGAPVCERVQLMNLALGYEADLYCLDCLAQLQDMPADELAAFAKSYISSRDCFKAPWLKFNARDCPKLETGACFCQHLNDEEAAG